MGRIEARKPSGPCVTRVAGTTAHRSARTAPGSSTSNFRCAGWYMPRQYRLDVRAPVMCPSTGIVIAATIFVIRADLLRSDRHSKGAAAPGGTTAPERDGQKPQF